MKQGRDFLWLCGFGIAAFVIYTFNLGDVPLRDWDEAIVAGVSREIYRATDNYTWLYPKTVGGLPYWNKPPLIHWLVAISYSWFGVSEWSSRLPSAILSALSVPIVYGIGRLIFPRRITAILASTVYLTLIQMVRHGRLAMLDGAIACWFGIIILGLLIARFNICGLWLVGLGLSCASFTKGIAIGILLGAIVVIFGWIENNKPSKVNQSSWYKSSSLTLLLFTILLSFLPVTIWYSLQYLRYGQEFLGLNLGGQTFGRIWSTVENHQGEPWYYLVIMAKDTLPWLFFLPGGIKLLIKQRDRLWAKLVLVWGGVYLLTISLMATKLPWYIIPIYPAISLIIGANLSDIWHKYKSKKVTRNYLLISLFSLVTIGCTIASIVYSLSFQISEQDLLFVFATLATGFAITTVLLLQKSHYFIIAIAASLYISLLCFFNTNHWNWELGEQYPVKPVAAMIQNSTTSNQTIYTSYPYNRPSLNFYSDRVIIPKSDAQLQQLWQSPSAYFLLSSDAIKRLNLSNINVISSIKSWQIVTRRK
ncbi:MAG: glycosyltransferase family 39 protein [Xenococcaceae cyanobacterium MO_167.B52]|nr:glycosyltransferase family 39 protein [Xenococcaceae cyanobacterium MO_167.B52]